MRFNSVATIVFMDINGKSYEVKDIRPVSTFKNQQPIQWMKGQRIDEVITRPEYYGQNTEDLTWAVVDNNIEVLAENNFDLDNIKTLNIPVIESY